MVVTVVDIAETAGEGLDVGDVFIADVVAQLVHGICWGEQSEQVGPVGADIGITIHPQGEVVVVQSVLQCGGFYVEAVDGVLLRVVALLLLQFLEYGDASLDALDDVG